MTQTYKVADMTCGKCVATITKTIAALDPEAIVDCDLQTKEVRITSHADATRVTAALGDAGFEAELLAA